MVRIMAIASLFFGAMSGSSAKAASEPDGYPALVKLFQQWREFERPVMKNNVPDYSASAMAAKAAALPGWRKRLDAIDPKSCRHYVVFPKTAWELPRAQYSVNRAPQRSQTSSLHPLG